MKCCGQRVASKFCPECGKNLGWTPLDDLLKRVEENTRGLRTRYENWFNQPLTEGETETPKRKKRREKFLANVERNELWVKLLRELLDKTRE